GNQCDESKDTIDCGLAKRRLSQKRALRGLRHKPTNSGQMDRTISGAGCGRTRGTESGTTATSQSNSRGVARPDYADQTRAPEVGTKKGYGPACRAAAGT